MLDQISAGASYEDALKDAQDKGFAEADPTADVGGADAAAKIRLVARYGFGTEVALDDIPRDTIGQPKPSWRICLIFLLRAHFNLNKRAAARVESLA